MPSNQIIEIEPSPHNHRDAASIREFALTISRSNIQSALLDVADGVEQGGIFVSKKDSLVTPQEAANFFGVSRQYIEKLIVLNKIPAGFKPASKHKVIQLSVLEEFFKERLIRREKANQSLRELKELGFDV